MVEPMEASRSQLDRLLDPENGRITLQSLKRAGANPVVSTVRATDAGDFALVSNGRIS